MGRPPIINRTQVVKAALDLIDAEGIEALSIERLGREVGVRGPTLYHHFDGKAEILAEVALLVLGDLDLEGQTENWQEFMVDTSIAFYRSLQEHPNAVTMLIQALPDSVALPGFERAAQLLTEAEVDPGIHLLLMEGTEKLVWGWALQRSMMTRNGDRLNQPEHEDRWPALTVASAENRRTDEEMLEESIRAFHRGLLGSIDEQD